MLKWVSKLKTNKSLKLLLVEVKPNNNKLIRLEMVGMAQTRLKCLIYIVVPRVRAENQISWIKRALHYPFNWIPFLQIKKLCNVIAKNLTFLTNRKLISISWKVWTCSSFSTNWKWKWMNRIRHGRKFELSWKIIYLYKSNQFACY